MRIFVTGGCGFLGSHFIKHILKTYPQYKIINFDVLTYCGNPQNIQDIAEDPRYQFVKGDIRDQHAVRDAMSGGIDAIVNYAAETHVDRSIMDARSFIETDVLGTYTLLEVARECGVKKYIQISTDEVFGVISEGSFTESSCFLPNSPYAASKAGGDLLCRAYVATHNFPAIMTHACNCYGSYQYPEKFIPLFITNLLEGKRVPLYGDGKQVREWLHAADHAAAIDFLLHYGVIGERYCIGSGEEQENYDVVRALLDMLGYEDGMVDYVKDRPGHDRRYSVNSSKLHALGWKAHYHFQDGLRETVEWYRNHPQWWKPLKNGEYLEYYRKQYTDKT